MRSWQFVTVMVSEKMANVRGISFLFLNCTGLLAGLTLIITYSHLFHASPKISATRQPNDWTNWERTNQITRLNSSCYVKRNRRPCPTHYHFPNTVLRNLTIITFNVARKCQRSKFFPCPGGPIVGRPAERPNTDHYIHSLLVFMPVRNERLTACLCSAGSKHWHS